MNLPVGLHVCILNILTQLVLHFAYTTHSIFRMFCSLYFSFSRFLLFVCFSFFILTHFVRFAYSITFELLFWLRFTSKPMSVNCSTILEVVDLVVSVNCSFISKTALLCALCEYKRHSRAIKITTSFVWGDFFSTFDCF